MVEKEKFKSTLQKIVSSDWLNAMPVKGDAIGQFRILNRLGNGGMGCVFKVFISKLETIRAIKILRGDSGQIFRDRFSKEAKITANLDHPNIIRVYNVYKWKNDLPFIEMEYVDGLSLEQILIHQKKLHTVVALSVFVLVCKALTYASDKEFVINEKTVSNLIHRDLKPGNVMISKNGTVKLSDFGLAGFISVEENNTPMGSQAYIAPEGLQNRALDVRSDIYSLGIMLYELICGQRPFPDTGFLGGDNITAKLKGEYPSIGSKIQSVGKSVSYIIDKCLQKNPLKRFQNYKQLNFECESALEEITSSTPEDIIKNFTKNPKYLKIKPSQTKKRNIKKRVLISVLILLMSAIVLVVSIKVKNRMFINNSDEYVKNKTNIVEKKMFDNKNFVVKGKVKTKQKINISIKKKIIGKNLKTNPDKKSIQPNDTIDLKIATETESILMPCISELQNKNYSRAIKNLNLLRSKNMGRQTRDSLNLYLIEAYIKNGSIRDAHIHAFERTINDGYYYLLIALIHDYAGNYSKANDAFDKAVSIKSIFGINKKHEAMFKRIQFLYNQYKKTKDSIIRIKTYNSCNAYISLICESSENLSENCIVVHEIIKNLEGLNG